MQVSPETLNNPVRNPRAALLLPVLPPPELDVRQGHGAGLIVVQDVEESPHGRDELDWEPLQGPGLPRHDGQDRVGQSRRP